MEPKSDENPKQIEEMHQEGDHDSGEKTDMDDSVVVDSGGESNREEDSNVVGSRAKDTSGEDSSGNECSGIDSHGKDSSKEDPSREESVGKDSSENDSSGKGLIEEDKNTESTGRTDPGRDVTDDSGDQRFEVKLHVSTTNEEDIVVRVRGGNAVEISVRQPQDQNEQDLPTAPIWKMVCTLELPQGISPDSLQAFLSSQGILTLAATTANDPRLDPSILPILRVDTVLPMPIAPYRENQPGQYSEISSAITDGFEALTEAVKHLDTVNVEKCDKILETTQQFGTKLDEVLDKMDPCGSETGSVEPKPAKITRRRGHISELEFLPETSAAAPAQDSFSSKEIPATSSPSKITTRKRTHSISDSIEVDDDACKMPPPSKIPPVARQPRQFKAADVMPSQDYPYINRFPSDFDADPKQSGSQATSQQASSKDMPSTLNPRIEEPVGPLSRTCSQMSPDQYEQYILARARHHWKKAMVGEERQFLVDMLNGDVYNLNLVKRSTMNAGHVPDDTGCCCSFRNN